MTKELWEFIDEVTPEQMDEWISQAPSELREFLTAFAIHYVHHGDESVNFKCAIELIAIATGVV